MKISIDPSTRMLRGIKGEYYIVREVAEKTGISENIIRKGIRRGVKEMMPSKTTANGKIYLFTPEDINRISKYYEEKNAPKDFDGVVPSGRPKRYSEEERLERARLHSQANYWKRRITEGKTEKDREKAKIKHEIVRRELHGE